MKIRIGILGCGNLGRGVEAAVTNSDDMVLAGLFTRRDPAEIKTATGAPIYGTDRILAFTEKIDVLILCGGSLCDLPVQTPEMAGHFHVVDSFDTHAEIAVHFAKVDTQAKAAGKLAIISCGWDPGLFSLNRLLAQAILPNGTDHTFWGKGVSQGHSDAIRRINGVLDARQYTIPVDAALESVRKGEQLQLSTRQKHTRECFVVAAPGADRARIRHEIITMPHYFADYETTVHFISREELDRNHANSPHGGTVICSGTTGLDAENRHVIEYKLTLASNPQFTGSVLVAYARAAYRMAQAGMPGCKTVFDVPPIYLHPKSRAALLKTIL